MNAERSDTQRPVSLMGLSEALWEHRKGQIRRPMWSGKASLGGGPLSLPLSSSRAPSLAAATKAILFRPQLHTR